MPESQLVRLQLDSGTMVLRNKRYASLITLIAMVAFGCGVPERPTVIAISKSPAFRPSRERCQGSYY